MTRAPENVLVLDDRASASAPRGSACLQAPRAVAGKSERAPGVAVRLAFVPHGTRNGPLIRFLLLREPVRSAFCDLLPCAIKETGTYLNNHEVRPRTAASRGGSGTRRVTASGTDARGGSGRTSRGVEHRAVSHRSCRCVFPLRTPRADRTCLHSGHTVTLDVK